MAGACRCQLAGVQSGLTACFDGIGGRSDLRYVVMVKSRRADGRD